MEYPVRSPRCCHLPAAFIVYPPFLRAARVHVGHRSVITPVLERFFTKRHFLIAIATLIVAVALAPSALRVNTDPPLQSYFQQNDSVRTGIEAVDRAGGSAPLDLVIADSGGQLLAGGNVYERLVALQHDLERHKDVGSVLSIALLMQETKRPGIPSCLRGKGGSTLSTVRSTTESGARS